MFGTAHVRTGGAKRWYGKARGHEGGPEKAGEAAQRRIGVEARDWCTVQKSIK